VRLWNVAGAQQILTLEGHSGRVGCVSFAPDGHVLASGGESPDGNGEVYLWRIDRRSADRSDSIDWGRKDAPDKPVSQAQAHRLQPVGLGVPTKKASPP
jgi:WD40 repeat protein